MKILTALFMFTFMNLATANNQRIICQSANEEKSFIIDNSKIAFFKSDEFTKSGFRTLASIEINTHQNTAQGFSKVLYKDGMRHRVFIKNTKKFNEVDDFISITSKQGHVMTYPISCELFY